MGIPTCLLRFILISKFEYNLVEESNEILFSIGSIT